jgi:threonine dehydrogenase-like Zn-dependent dehydrogenase
MIDTNSFRLNIARNLGLFCIDGRQSRLHQIIKERSSPGKDGPDVVIETSGNPSGLDWATRWVRVQGQMIVAGRIPSKGLLDLMNLFEKEISLTGTFAYTQEDLIESLSDISNLRIDYQTLITQRLPLAGVREGLRILRSVEETMEIVICMDPFK